MINPATQPGVKACCQEQNISSRIAALCSQPGVCSIKNSPLSSPRGNLAEWLPFLMAFSCSCLCSVPRGGAGAAHCAPAQHGSTPSSAQEAEGRTAAEAWLCTLSSCQAAPRQHFTSAGTAQGHRISLAVLSQMLSPSDRGERLANSLEVSAPLLQEHSL